MEITSSIMEKLFILLQSYWLPLTIFSIFTFVFTLAAVPFLLVRMPEDYFLNGKTQGKGWLHRIGWIIRNFLGAGIFLFGILLLFLPGQGILTLLIALSIMDFPGKKRLERALLHRPGVHNAVNRLRARYGKAPIQLPE